jgi:ABC-type lipoprotein export system ATPase subunit
VALARALVHRPQLVFADEPTGSLDGEAAEQVMAALQELRGEREASVVVVTHDPAWAEQADRCLRLRAGHLVS